MSKAGTVEGGRQRIAAVWDSCEEAGWLPEMASHFGDFFSPFLQSRYKAAWVAWSLWPRLTLHWQSWP